MDDQSNNEMSQTMKMDYGGMSNQANMDGGMMSMMMPMYFEAGTKTTILFESWKTTDAWSLFGSVIAIILMGFLYEALKYLREYLMCKQQACSGRPESQNLLHQPNAQTSTTPNREDTRRVDNILPGTTCRKDVCNGFHLLQTCLHFIQIGLGYLLMLVAMTYNVWCFLGVLLGCALGYFAFGWKRYHLSDFSDHCN